jgi:hypothetical protein
MVSANSSIRSAQNRVFVRTTQNGSAQRHFQQQISQCRQNRKHRTKAGQKGVQNRFPRQVFFSQNSAASQKIKGNNRLSHKQSQKQIANALVCSVVRTSASKQKQKQEKSQQQHFRFFFVSFVCFRSKAKTKQSASSPGATKFPVVGYSFVFSQVFRCPFGQQLKMATSVARGQKNTKSKKAQEKQQQSTNISLVFGQHKFFFSPRPSSFVSSPAARLSLSTSFPLLSLFPPFVHPSSRRRGLRQATETKGQKRRSNRQSHKSTNHRNITSYKMTKTPKKFSSRL